MDIKTKYNPGDIVYHVRGCISLKNDDLKIWVLKIRTCRCVLGNKEDPCCSPVYLCDIVSKDITKPSEKNDNFTELSDRDWPEEDLLTYDELHDILINKKHFIISTLLKLEERNLFALAIKKWEED